MDILRDCRTSRSHNSNEETPSLQERQRILRILVLYSLQLRRGEPGRGMAPSLFCYPRAFYEGLQIDDTFELKTLVEFLDLGLKLRILLADEWVVYSN